jgi:hypothetical protein
VETGADNIEDILEGKMKIEWDEIMKIMGKLSKNFANN